MDLRNLWGSLRQGFPYLLSIFQRYSILNISFEQFHISRYVLSKIAKDQLIIPLLSRHNIHNV